MNRLTHWLVTLLSFVNKVYLISITILINGFTPRTQWISIMQKWILSLNIGFVLLIIVVLSLIFSNLASFKLARMYSKGAPKQTVTTSIPAVIEDLPSFSIILEKGLFGRLTQGRLTPVMATGTEAKAAQQAVAQGDLLLLGTVIGSFRETFALIQKSGTKEERVFRLGDQVYGIGPLVAVKSDTAEILVAGKRVTILSPLAVTAGTNAPAQIASPVSGVVAPLAAPAGGGNYVIEQRALNAALDNIGQAMTDARLLPSVKEGKVEGFRASEVKPQGIFGMIGIRNGDILLRINEFPIDSPEKAIQSFASLKGQNRIKLDIIRDGQPSTFNYDIR